MPGSRHSLQVCLPLTAQGAAQLFRVSVVGLAASNTDLQATTYGTATCAQCTSSEQPCTSIAQYRKAQTFYVRSQAESGAELAVKFASRAPCAKANAARRTAAKSLTAAIL